MDKAIIAWDFDSTAVMSNQISQVSKHKHFSYVSVVLEVTAT